MFYKLGADVPALDLEQSFSSNITVTSSPWAVRHSWLESDYSFGCFWGIFFQ